ncbi:MAG: hypothetical protein Ta2B_26550 [Termitinemataceae bacterium]|nr:MAG: hypothetical protein Ta2B_26550 [Termitinemataceae bacterium]
MEIFFIRAVGFNTFCTLDVSRARLCGGDFYLDPPYNGRQYGANYHILNTIARYENFEPKGKTGLPIYKKSLYCSRSSVLSEFDDLIKIPAAERRGFLFSRRVALRV